VDGICWTKYLLGKSIVSAKEFLDFSKLKSNQIKLCHQWRLSLQALKENSPTSGLLRFLVAWGGIELSLKMVNPDFLYV
jgi:hypothetical protein